MQLPMMNIVALIVQLMIVDGHVSNQMFGLQKIVSADATGKVIIHTILQNHALK